MFRQEESDRAPPKPIIVCFFRLVSRRNVVISLVLLASCESISAFCGLGAGAGVLELVGGVVVVVVVGPGFGFGLNKSRISGRSMKDFGSSLSKHSAMSEDDE